MIIPFSIIAFPFSLLLLVCAYSGLTKTLSSPPGNEPQTEKQVEKVSTLSLVRRDTALLLRDFRQGASNWIQSLLDPNRASASSSTVAEAAPGPTGIPSSAIVYMNVCVHVQSCGNIRRDVGGINVFCSAAIVFKVTYRCNLLLVIISYMLKVHFRSMVVYGWNTSHIFSLLIKLIYLSVVSTTISTPKVHLHSIWRRLLT